MRTSFPFDQWTKQNPFDLWMKPGREAAHPDMWAKPGRDAFEFWISFFPTAPLFGVEWRFANMADPTLNPFMMPGMPGARAAAMASHPGELASPAAADEDAAKPVARVADTAGEVAEDMTRIVCETGKAAARTADAAMKAGADVAETSVEVEAKAVDVAEETAKTARRATETAATAVEDAATRAEIAAEETAGAVAGGTRRGAKAARETAEKAGSTTGKAADDVDEAVAAAQKPKVLLDKRPDETDDLKAIKGIGPDLERQLNGLGLYRFDQLAKMSDADLAWVDANITRFKGRCFRDDWVGQAKSRLSR